MPHLTTSKIFILLFICSVLGCSEENKVSELSKVSEPKISLDEIQTKVHKKACIDLCLMMDASTVVDHFAYFKRIMIKNNCAAKTFKDIKIEVVFVSPSSTVLDTKIVTIYDILRPDQAKTWKEVDIGFIREGKQVKWLSHRVIDAELIEEE